MHRGAAAESEWNLKSLTRSSAHATHKVSNSHEMWLVLCLFRQFSVHSDRNIGSSPFIAMGLSHLKLAIQRCTLSSHAVRSLANLLSLFSQIAELRFPLDIGLNICSSACTSKQTWPGIFSPFPKSVPPSAVPSFPPFAVSFVIFHPGLQTVIGLPFCVIQ